jgi:hypothetical protein
MSQCIIILLYAERITSSKTLLKLAVLNIQNVILKINIMDINDNHNILMINLQKPYALLLVLFETTLSLVSTLFHFFYF